MGVSCEFYYLRIQQYPQNRTVDGPPDATVRRRGSRWCLVVSGTGAAGRREIEGFAPVCPWLSGTVCEAGGEAAGHPPGRPVRHRPDAVPGGPSRPAGIARGGGESRRLRLAVRLPEGRSVPCGRVGEARRGAMVLPRPPRDGAADSSVRPQPIWFARRVRPAASVLLCSGGPARDRHGPAGLAMTLTRHFDPAIAFRGDLADMGGGGNPAAAEGGGERLQAVCGNRHQQSPRGLRVAEE